MKGEEIKTLFEKGEVLSCFFGIRNERYTLGDKRILKSQYKMIVREYKGRYIFDMSTTGFTRHNYKFNKTI